MAERTVTSRAMLRVNPDLAWREFDGEIVAYHEASGHSFLISGMAARMFAALRGGSVARAELARRFVPGDAIAPTSDAAEVFNASLAFLEELEAVLRDASG